MECIGEYWSQDINFVDKTAECFIEIGEPNYRAQGLV